MSQLRRLIECIWIRNANYDVAGINATSKGIAGVPRASLVVVLATCSMFNIPPEGIALILPIDHFCDMFRTMTNVLGNALATTAVSKWEGELAS